MTIIEVLQPEGAIQVYATEERSYEAVCKEVSRLYPDATHWRKSKDWRGVADGKAVDGASPLSSVAKIIVAVLVLAIILTPVITWGASLGNGSEPILSLFTRDSTASGVEADEVGAYPAPDAGSVSEFVHIVGIAEQSSDTSKTLRVQLHNDGMQTQPDVRVRATFYDTFGAEIPLEDSNLGVATIGADQDGYVKVWAHSEYGVGRYELEILDEAQ